MMLCSRCGHNLPDHANFCGKCGNPMKVSPTQSINSHNRIDQVAENNGRKIYPGKILYDNNHDKVLVVKVFGTHFMSSKYGKDWSIHLVSEFGLTLFFSLDELSEYEKRKNQDQSKQMAITDNKQNNSKIINRLDDKKTKENDQDVIHNTRKNNFKHVEVSLCYKCVKMITGQCWGEANPCELFVQQLDTDITGNWPKRQQGAYGDETIY